MEIGYRIVERFSPADGDRWEKYVDWSGLRHLIEVVGLDCMLCPTILEKYIDEDWRHLAFANYMFGCFNSLEYVLERLKGRFDVGRHQVLAISREPPSGELGDVLLPGFRMLGCELLDEETGISALTNCGGFEGAFESSDLSEHGLIVDARRAYEVREALARLFPQEGHADCAVWAVWRREP